MKNLLGLSPLAPPPLRNPPLQHCPWPLQHRPWPNPCGAAPLTTDDRASCFVIGDPPIYAIWRIHKAQSHSLELVEVAASKEFPRVGLRFTFPGAFCPFAFIYKNELTTIKLLLLLNVFGFGAMLLSTLYLSKGSKRLAIIGWICLVFNINVFAAPLFIILSVPDCIRLTIEGILFNLRALKSSGKLGIKHLRIGGLAGVCQVTDQQFEEGGKEASNCTIISQRTMYQFCLYG